jgi:uncharacterized protein YndB with AHSA1/START domain
MEEEMDLLEGGPDKDIVTMRVLNAPRERVFRAWTEPEHLQKWWGPKGFTNTFKEHDLRPGGTWSFVMHGPEGGNYNNECVFIRIEPPGFIAWEHVSPPYFHIIARFDELAGDRTQLTWTMRFRTAEEREKLRTFVIEKNEENLDRLEAELEQMRQHLSGS